MNFSSIQAYLQPSNWEQQNLQLIGNNGTNPLLQQAPQTGFPTAPPQPHAGGGGPGAIRPGSMSERARMANLQMPEAALKCPRCDSTNTKFCYFNNYSLTQPRHFCKSCRRYWTKGGALRSVPVGGGCRRNKRSKSSNSKSPMRNEKLQTASTSTSSVSATLGQQQSQQFAPLRLMPPLLGQHFTNDMVLSYSTAVSTPMLGTSDQMNMFHGTATPNLFGSDQSWRLQQFPLFDGSDPSPLANYQFQHPSFPSSMMTTTQLQQASSVKSEENPEMNRSRQNGLSGTTTAWSDDQLPNFTSSSTNNISPRID